MGSQRCIPSHQPPHIPTICTRNISIYKSRWTVVRKSHSDCLLSLWVILSKTPTIHTQQSAGAKPKWKTAWENGSTAGQRLEPLNRWKARSWTSYPKDLISACCSTSTMPAQNCVSHKKFGQDPQDQEHVQPNQLNRLPAIFIQHNVIL